MIISNASEVKNYLKNLVSMDWHGFNKNNVLGHSHDPFHPGGCPGCRERHQHFERQTATSTQQTEMQTHSICNRVLHPLKQYREALLYFNTNDFKSAKYHFYHALLDLFKDIDRTKNTRHLRCTSNSDKQLFESIYVGTMNRCICLLLLYCYQCHKYLQQWSSCMRELNRIVSICMPCIPLKPTHNYCIPGQMHEMLKKTLMCRAKLFEKMGNSAHALSDYILLESLGCSVYVPHTTTLASRKHPDPQSLITCDINTKQMVTFASNKGWKQIQPIKAANMLPTKYGHAMFVYNTASCHIPYGGRENATTQNIPVYPTLSQGKNISLSCSV
eukprot:344313_1